ncbi:MAG: DUF255 domain-containing protein [Thermomicrobiales bacterium]
MRQNISPPLSLSVREANPESARSLPDVASVIPWSTWPEGLEEAQRYKRPILALAEPTWANSAQRLSFILEQDASITSLISKHVVPILLDPDERPDLVTAWRYASVTQTGTSGPPLLMLLTHEGGPILSYCNMSIEGNDLYPSLASVIESLSEEYGNDPDRFLLEARSPFDLSAKLPSAEDKEIGWGGLRQQLDLTYGGLSELPKHPRPFLLWTLLEAHDQDVLPDDLVRWLVRSLDSMVRGAMYDQIDRGFHRCARDDRWILPHFEKPIPLNAQLAAVYARAADQFQNRHYRDISNHLLSFCLVALHGNVDVIASDSNYYTWTAKEILNTLEPTLVQVVSLHYDITPISNRQALHRAVELEDMDRYSHEDLDVLRARLIKGRAQLRLARQRRPAPPVLSLPTLSWRAETVRWLFSAARWTPTLDIPEVESSLDQLISGRFDSRRGYLRQGYEAPAFSAWLEDQASLLGAFISAYAVTGSPRWLERSKELADVVIAQYWSDAGWLDQANGNALSFAVIDDVIPSTIGTLTIALMQLAEALGDPAIVEQVSKAARAHSPMAARSGYWAIAAWQSSPPQ